MKGCFLASSKTDTPLGLDDKKENLQLMSISLFNTDS